MNHRDKDLSINNCLGEKIFNENVSHRSAGWIYGWSCSKVGNTDKIFSLNYLPKKMNDFSVMKAKQKLLVYFSMKKLY